MGSTGEGADKISGLGNLSDSTVSYITPWIGLAETAARNDGKLAPADWASAVGSTLSQSVTASFGSQGGDFSAQLTNASLWLGTNALVAGVLNEYDEDAAQSYFESSIGQEAGQFIGGYLGNAILGGFQRSGGSNYGGGSDLGPDNESLGSDNIGGDDDDLNGVYGGGEGASPDAGNSNNGGSLTYDSETNVSRDPRGNPVSTQRSVTPSGGNRAWR